MTILRRIIGALFPEPHPDDPSFRSPVKGGWKPAPRHPQAPPPPPPWKDSGVPIREGGAK